MSESNGVPAVEGLAPEPRTQRARAAAALLRDVALAVIVLVLVGAFLAQPFRVQGESMAPTLSTGDRIIVSKVSYRVGDIERFDVVVMESPEGLAVVKRIVGLPGERLAIADGVVLIDGRPIAVPLAVECRGEDRAEVELGPDEYFALGDNRRVSVDSRRFGPVARHDVRGKAVLRYWPPSSAGSFGPRDEGPR